MNRTFEVYNNKGFYLSRKSDYEQMINMHVNKDAAARVGFDLIWLAKAVAGCCRTHSVRARVCFIYCNIFNAFLKCSYAI